jgi:short-subunit dehydrogenase
LQLARGGVRVAASARSAERLAELAMQQSNVSSVPLDVTQHEAVSAAWRTIVDTIGVPDLVVLNAGIWHPMDATQFDAAKAAESMSVNYGGVINAIESALPEMLARGTGQIALVASVAGYRGLPKAAAYAPSKAAVIALAESLRLDLAATGLTVSLVNPGFVETPMTAVNTFPMPFIIQADDAARRIIAGLQSGRFEIAFPWKLVAILKLLRVLPYRLYFGLVSRSTRH